MGFPARLDFAVSTDSPVRVVQRTRASSRNFRKLHFGLGIKSASEDVEG